MKTDGKGTDLSRLRIDRSAAPERRGVPKWAVLAIVSLVLVGVAVVWISGAGKAGEEFPVRTALATLTSPTSGSALLNASGYVVAQRQAAVSSKATGRLVHLAVEEGDRVRKGQLIGRVESDDVEAALQQAEANLNVARGREGTAAARLKEAEITFDRVKELLNRELASQAEYDNAEAALGVARAEHRAATAGVDAAAAAVRAAEVAVENTRIRAPFDGTVLTKTADVGEMVAPFASSQSSRGAVVTLADMGSLEVEADVSESNIQRVTPGAPAEIVLDAYPDQRYAGRVKKIVPTADRAKATVLTKVEFVNIDSRVLPEMSAKVTFLSADATDAGGAPQLTVPAGAVQEQDGQAWVFVVEKDHAHRREVSAGAKVNGSRVIVSGLIAGDRVIVDPPTDLEDGATVKAD